MQKRGLLRREGEQALDALGGDDDHLARLDVAHEARADDVEGAGLRGQDPAPSRSPSTSGRTPSGSRQPIIFFADSATSE